MGLYSQARFCYVEVHHKKETKIMIPPVKVKYISNKELLVEIGRSKASFCYFISPEYSSFDAVISSLDLLTPELLAATILIKAAKLSSKTNIVDPSTINPESVVFRVMTDAHLPHETDEKRRKKSSRGEWVTKPNFPPFSHYIVVDGYPVEVGRSHWRDGLHNGRFSLVDGKMSNRLAQMFMLLAEQYSHRGNWRGYCVDQETEALTQRGWLGINDITEDDIILSYDDDKLKWSRIKSIFRDDYDGKMFHLTVVGMDALVTPHHKFVTDKGLKEVELLLEKDKIILTGEYVEDGSTTYSDAFVELIGWIVTEGNYYFSEERNYCRMTIFQNEGDYAERIRACLNTLDVQYSEFHRDNRENGKPTVAFNLSKAISEQIMAVAGDRIMSMPFILSLSQAQRELLINTMIDADGWRTIQECKTVSRRYCQKDIRHVDAFAALCTLAGYRVSAKLQDIESSGKPTQIYQMNIFSRTNSSNVENIDFHGGKRSGSGRGKEHHQNVPTVDYQGRVWCPETEYGSFMARRNGYIYLTGNTYVDEMRAHALVHLAAVGLQFDESRSSNPFSFLTQVIKHCFTRVLNLEKRNQNIRDDLLIMAGVSPSFARQVDNEMDQRDDANNKSETEDTVKKIPAKRGRKPKLQA